MMKPQQNIRIQEIQELFEWREDINCMNINLYEIISLNMQR